MLRKFAALCFPCTQCCDNQNLQLSTMGADESKPRGVSRRELNDALARERSRTEARLRQELLATPPSGTAVTEPVVTRNELEKILERERILTENKVRQELSVQQPIREPFVNASAPPPPAQPSTAGYNVYPQLHDNNPRPVVEAPHQQTSAPSFVRANPSAPVLQDNVRPKERTGRPFRFDGNIDKDVQCPTCESIYGVNIYKCMQGHSACEECKERNSKCVLCRNAITSVRNYSLEEYISNKKIPCPNEREGCCLTIKFSELEAHLKACPFKKLICPLHPIYGNCTWKGKLSKLSAHFKIEHPDNCGAVNEEMELKNLTTYSRKVFLATLGSYNFIVHIEVIPNDQKIYMTTQLCGTHNAASKWDYELHLYKKSEPRRKYMYTDVCKPHSTQVAEIFSSNKCVILPSVYFMNFMNLGTINYKFYLKKRLGTNENNSNEEKNVKPRYNRNRSYGRNKDRVTS